jgi:hypothetical protein
MAESSDLLIIVAVIAARLLVPLTIPRFPLPGVIACLIIDGVDQTIFQKFTSLPLENYQGYDKSLDIYYLTVAYISTMRNWSNLFAFKVSAFLFYYRLVGVVAFELSQIRALLMIFPNTFEYFFIFYEAYRLRWSPVRMTHKFLIGAAAFIWIFIKLPQEYIIHVGQIDMTDWFKTNLFHVPTDATASEIWAAAAPTVIAIIVLAIALVVLAWWIITRKLPPADRALNFAANMLAPRTDMGSGDESGDGDRGETIKPPSKRFFNSVLVEKIALVSLVGIIFAQVLPDVRVSNIQFTVGVAFVIALNTLVSEWLARHGHGWESILREFLVMAVVNFGLILLYSFLLPSLGGSIHLGNTLFFVFLLTLIVTLFDRYRPVLEAHFVAAD